MTPVERCCWVIEELEMSPRCSLRSEIVARASNDAGFLGSFWELANSSGVVGVVLSPGLGVR